MYYFTTHVHALAGGNVFRAGVHIYIHIHMFVEELNRTLAIDSPFQTFAVGLLVEFIDELYDYVLHNRFPHRVNQGYPYIMRTLL